MLQLAIHQHLRFVLLAPRYPENLGAACRAIKAMGFTRIDLVAPGHLAKPDHPMAEKMAVSSGDVLASCRIHKNLDAALAGVDLIVGTTARRGVSGVSSPRDLAPRLLDAAEQDQQVAVLFGNEKHGLSKADLSHCDALLRISIAADQPSLNLAQAIQIISYELFTLALARRGAAKNSPSTGRHTGPSGPP